VRCNLVKEEAGWSSTAIHPGPRRTVSGSGRADRDQQAHTVEITTPTAHRYRSTAPPVLLPAPSLITSSPGTAREVDIGRAGRPAGAGATVIELYRNPGLKVALTA